MSDGELRFASKNWPGSRPCAHMDSHRPPGTLRDAVCKRCARMRQKRFWFRIHDVLNLYSPTGLLSLPKSLAGGYVLTVMLLTANVASRPLTRSGAVKPRILAVSVTAQGYQVGG